MCWIETKDVFVFGGRIGEHKKAKSVNKNVGATISHDEYKNVLLNKKCLRHSMNRIQSKDHRAAAYEMNKINFSCFDNKIHRL